MTVRSADVTAQAHPNIALVKYWGKAPGAGNRPAAPSLSITLDGLSTRTRVTTPPDLPADVVHLNDEATENTKILDHVARLKTLADDPVPNLKIETWNDFPTAAGLASSASGFAALTVALDRAMGLGLDVRQQSSCARMASASAARSFFGGFVTLPGGPQTAPDTIDDGWAEPLKPAEHWPLRVIVAVCSTAEKAVSSTAGMQASRSTSPYFSAWCEATHGYFDSARKAVIERDFEALAEIAEASCLGMHAVMLSTRPALIYWTPATLAAIECIRQLRANGTPVFFTIDAGPQLKAVCEPAVADRVAAELGGVTGVQSVIRAGLGEGAAVLDTA